MIYIALGLLTLTISGFSIYYCIENDIIKVDEYLVKLDKSVNEMGYGFMKMLERLNINIDNNIRREKKDDEINKEREEREEIEKDIEIKTVEELEELLIIMHWYEVTMCQLI